VEGLTGKPSGSPYRNVDLARPRLTDDDCRREIKQVSGLARGPNVKRATSD